MRTGPSSVEAMGDLLVRSRLLTAEEVQDLLRRWRGEAGETAGLEAFRSWLVTNEYLTDYQAAALVQGHGDHFFLGPYKLLEHIGKGRVALVYKAVHRLGRVVALKVLPPSRARDPHLLARFRQEATLGSQLRHPNVVRIMEPGEADGLYYLAMEHLEGETLQEFLGRRGPLDPAEAARLTLQALAGLQYLHEQGMAHRNLKPANLMLVRRKGRTHRKRRAGRLENPRPHHEPGGGWCSHPRGGRCSVRTCAAWVASFTRLWPGNPPFRT